MMRSVFKPIILILSILTFSCSEKDEELEKMSEHTGAPNIEESDDNSGESNSVFAHPLAVYDIKVRLSANFVQPGHIINYKEAYLKIFEKDAGTFNIPGTTVTFRDVTDMPSASDGICPVSDIQINVDDDLYTPGGEGGKFGEGQFPSTDGAVGDRVEIDINDFDSDAKDSGANGANIAKAFRRLILHELYHTVGLPDDVNMLGHAMTSFQARSKCGPTPHNFVVFMNSCTGDGFRDADDSALQMAYIELGPVLTPELVARGEWDLAWSWNPNIELTGWELERKTPGSDEFELIAEFDDGETSSYRDSTVPLDPEIVVYRLVAIKDCYRVATDFDLERPTPKDVNDYVQKITNLSPTSTGISIVKHFRAELEGYPGGFSYSTKWYRQDSESPFSFTEAVLAGTGPESIGIEGDAYLEGGNYGSMNYYVVFEADGKQTTPDQRVYSLSYLKDPGVHLLDN